MEHEQQFPDPTDAATAVLLALLTFATCTLLALTEQFAHLPGALAAYAAAHYIFRL